jgi:methyl-accepting chemotaxis protein
MVDPASLDHAIAAHAKWKFRLREAIKTGQSEWTVENVRPDDVCDFGKWLNALSLADRMMKEWHEVKALHAKFHASAADVLASAIAGRKSEADTSMAPGGAFSDVSTKLVKAITDWKKRLSGGAGH